MHRGTLSVVRCEAWNSKLTVWPRSPSARSVRTAAARCRDSTAQRAAPDDALSVAARRSGAACSPRGTRCPRRSGSRRKPSCRRSGEHDATFGDVHGWLEATGTEPTGIIGLHVWEEPSARSPLQEEMHARLVELPGGAAGRRGESTRTNGSRADDGERRQEYLALQERWMTTPLPDGRVPMTVLLDEQDEAFLADWAAADAEARSALAAVLRPGRRQAAARRRPGSGDRQAARGHRPARVARADAHLVQRAERGCAARRRRGAVADARHVGGLAAG